jgi:hypothetical protein
MRRAPRMVVEELLLRGLARTEQSANNRGEG